MPLKMPVIEIGIDIKKLLIKCVGITLHQNTL